MPSKKRKSGTHKIGSRTRKNGFTAPSGWRAWKAAQRQKRHESQKQTQGKKANSRQKDKSDMRVKGKNDHGRRHKGKHKVGSHTRAATAASAGGDSDAGEGNGSAGGARGRGGRGRGGRGRARGQGAQAFAPEPSAQNSGSLQGADDDLVSELSLQFPDSTSGSAVKPQKGARGGRRKLPQDENTEADPQAKRQRTGAMSAKDIQKKTKAAQTAQEAVVDTETFIKKLADSTLVAAVKTKEHGSLLKRVRACLGPAQVAALTKGDDADSFFATSSDAGGGAESVSILQNLRDMEKKLEGSDLLVKGIEDKNTTADDLEQSLEKAVAAGLEATQAVRRLVFQRHSSQSLSDKDMLHTYKNLMTYNAQGGEAENSGAKALLGLANICADRQEAAEIQEKWLLRDLVNVMQSAKTEDAKPCLEHLLAYCKCLGSIQTLASDVGTELADLAHMTEILSESGQEFVTLNRAQAARDKITQDSQSMRSQYPSVFVVSAIAFCYSDVMSSRAHSSPCVCMPSVRSWCVCALFVRSWCVCAPFVRSWCGRAPSCP